MGNAESSKFQCEFEAVSTNFFTFIIYFVKYYSILNLGNGAGIIPPFIIFVMTHRIGTKVIQKGPRDTQHNGIQRNRVKIVTQHKRHSA